MTLVTQEPLLSTKSIILPAELATFIDAGHTTLQTHDGEWELRVQAGGDSGIADALPPRSTVIAESGSGDFLFLRATPAGKYDAKVFVYWHEEERHETFAKNLKELIATSSAAPAASAARPAPAAAKPVPAAAAKYPVEELERALASTESSVRTEAMSRLKGSDFGVEAVPALRRALASEDVSVAILAAECIAKLGPAATSCPAAERSAEFGYSSLSGQLKVVGGKVWAYSGYANCYSACLRALVKTGFDPDFLVEYIHTHIGLSNPDDLIDSLTALRDLGTPDSIDLLKRAATFWLPELNMAKAKKVNALVASATATRK